jgi:hypothetical protein
MLLEVRQLLGSTRLDREPPVDGEVLAHRQTGHVAEVADVLAELVMKLAPLNHFC